jgi:hypothetical protein
MVVDGLTRTQPGRSDGEADAAAAQARDVSIRKTLRGEFGEVDADALVARVGQFLEQHPGLRELVTHESLRNSPEPFLLLARAVHNRGPLD